VATRKGKGEPCTHSHECNEKLVCRAQAQDAMMFACQPPLACE
jgi:hypothetical protein